MCARIVSCHGKLRSLYVWNNGRLLSQLALAVCAGSYTFKISPTKQRNNITMVLDRHILFIYISMITVTQKILHLHVNYSFLVQSTNLFN